jgi:hypothetical protein
MWPETLNRGQELRFLSMLERLAHNKGPLGPRIPGGPKLNPSIGGKDK